MKYWHTNPRLICFDTTPSDFSKLHSLRSRTKIEILLTAKHLIDEASIRLQEFDNIMGNKKNGKSGGSQFSTKFAVISLDSEGKELAKQWLAANHKDLDTFFVDLVRDGWKTSLRWDSENDCFIASATCVDDDNRNYDVCVTSRSDNMYEAVLINYYKIYILFDNKKLPVESAKANWG